MEITTEQFIEDYKNAEITPIQQTSRAAYNKVIVHGIHITIQTIYPNPLDFKNGIREYYKVADGYYMSREGQPIPPGADLEEDWDDEKYYWFSFDDENKMASFVLMCIRCGLGDWTPEMGGIPIIDYGKYEAITIDDE